MNKKHGGLLEDNGEAQIHQQMEEIKSLLKKFDNVEVVMENAALSASFLNYLFNKPQEYYSLLFYYAVQKYQRVNETKNCMRNYRHINMEIYTIFLHSNSLLYIPFDDSEILKNIEANIDNEECIIYFIRVLENIVSNILNPYFEQFKEAISLGLESFTSANKIHEDLTRLEELNIVECLHSAIINHLIRNQKTRCMPSPQQDMKNLQILYDFQVSAITQALNTQYEHFLLNKKYSDGVNMIPNNIIPINTLLSPSHIKLCAKQKIKGHSFEDCTLSKVTFCFVCKIILWGSDPCCLQCRNCKISIHRVCKDTVKECQIDIKATMEKDYSNMKFFNEMENEERITVVKHNGGNAILPDTSMPWEINQGSKCPTDEIQNTKSSEKAKVSRKPSLSKFLEWKQQCSSTFTGDKTRKNSIGTIGIKSTKSMTAKTDPKLTEVVTRSRSAGSSVSDYQTSLDKKQSNACAASEISNRSVEVLDDSVMNVLETFEPEKELQMFSKPLKKSDKGGYQRLLVLMEFHHKTRFIRMNLKRFKYFLVDPWIRLGEHRELFDSLSLNSIEKLYSLIGSLIDVIDSCKSEDSYDSSIAERILFWISENGDKNLQIWLHLSTDLCCTNILHSVKASWMEHRQMTSTLNSLFTVEINRLVLIEQLSNMRSLLFNLPMIVTKIVKDLKRFKQFQDEAKLWEQVGNKLTRLPHLIDQRCMPVVHIINNGIIVNSTLKYSRLKMGKEYRNEMEIFFNNFPKTIFKNNFIDFQFVKIANLRQYSHGETKLMQSSVYVREEIDAAVICYEKEMIILHKENEKYLLKKFKSPGANKLFPMIIFDQVHVTKHTVKENIQFQHELTVLLIDKAVLAQILFKEAKSRDMWYDVITKTTTSRHVDRYSKSEPSYVSTSTETSKSLQRLDEKLFGENEDANVDHSNISNIRNSFKTSVNHFINSFNLISNELSKSELHENDLKRIKNSGPQTTNEFMLGYMEVLKEFMILGAKMLDQVKSIDSGLLLQRDVVLMNLSKLRDITSMMNSLIQSDKRINIGTESSDNSTIGDDDPPDQDIHNSFEIKCYIEEIILSAERKFDSGISFP